MEQHTSRPAPQPIATNPGLADWLASIAAEQSAAPPEPLIYFVTDQFSLNVGSDQPIATCTSYDRLAAGLTDQRRLPPC